METEDQITIPVNTQKKEKDKKIIVAADWNYNITLINEINFKFNFH